jgi:hypothetical protein
MRRTVYFYAVLELGQPIAQRGLGDTGEQEKSRYGCKPPF